MGKFLHIHTYGGTLTIISETAPMAPVYFFSHGSTMMLGEESESATFWKKAGDEALANGIKGVIMMVRTTSCRPTPITC